MTVSVTDRLKTSTNVKRTTKTGKNRKIRQKENDFQ